MKTAVYDNKGKEIKQIDLPESVFGLDWNADLVHQVMTSMQTNERVAIAHTKTRGEVSGTGKKPWKQKGTGRARHGSRRSPIWVGGGVAHGPRNDKNFDRKVNKKMKTKSLYVILSQKLRDGEILLVDNLKFSAPKTKEALGTLTSLSKIKGYETLITKKKNSAYLAVGENDENVKKSFANISNIKLDEVRNLNPLDLLTYKYIVIENPEKSISSIVSRSEATKSTANIKDK